MIEAVLAALLILRRIRRGSKPLAIVGSPVGATKDCVVGVVPADQGLKAPGYLPSPLPGGTNAQHQNWRFGLVLSFPHRADQDAEQDGTRHAQRDLRSSEARRESHSGV